MKIKVIALCVILVFILFHFKHYINISNSSEIIQMNNFNSEDYSNLLREKKPIVIHNIYNNTSAFNNVKVVNISGLTIDRTINSNNIMKTTVANYNKTDKYNYSLGVLNHNDNINETGYKNLLLPLSIKTKKQFIYGNEKNPKTMIIGVRSEIEILVCTDGNCIISLYKPMYSGQLTLTNYTKNFYNLYIPKNNNIKTINITINSGDVIIIPGGWAYSIIFNDKTILYNVKNDSFFYNIFSLTKRLF